MYNFLKFLVLIINASHEKNNLTIFLIVVNYFRDSR